MAHSSECPSALPGSDSPELTTPVSAAAFPDAEHFGDASIISDGEDDVSVVHSASLPQHCNTGLLVHLEPPVEEAWPSTQLVSDSSWSEVHSGELFSLNSGDNRTALPYLQDSQPSASSFSPLRRGPLFAEHLEAPLPSSNPFTQCCAATAA